MPTKRQIEKAANAIKFLVPINSGGTLKIKNDALTEWTPKGLKGVKWPKGFSAIERKLLRLIAKKALSAR